MWGDTIRISRKKEEKEDRKERKKERKKERDVVLPGHQGRYSVQIGGDLLSALLPIYLGLPRWPY